MKRTVQLLKVACIVLLCSGLLPACSKNEETPTEPGNPNPTDITQPAGAAHADTIAGHLQFFNAVKRSGTAPKGPSGSSLKISFRDTLYLTDELKRPIKFLHADTTQNVAGVYVQIKATPGGASSFYYTVPEEPEMDDNDTVSVILAGVDPDGLVPFAGMPPAGGSLIFDVTITPYSESGQPLAEITRPVKISVPKVDLPGATGGCGLVLPPGDYWNWDLSLIEKGDGSGLLSFYNDPKKVWGAGGQLITGCCINGVSSYNAVLNCEKDPTKARRKRFPTFFQHQESATKFFANGTYSQFSTQTHANPDPLETDFCSAALGAVDKSVRTVIEDGNWTVTKRTPYKGDSLYLQLVQTASNGVGLVSPGGYIHQLDCNVLALVSPDREGGDQDFISFYTRINTSEDGWYELL